MTSSHVWLKGSAAAKTCRDMGFAVHTGRGIDRFFIQERDNPFNPSADIHRIPRNLIASVTIRARTLTQIAAGGYKVEGDTRMRVSAHMEMQRASQGFFTVERMAPSATQQDVDIAAPSLELALHIFQQAKTGAISPDPVHDDKLMSMFD